MNVVRDVVALLESDRGAETTGDQLAPTWAFNGLATPPAVVRRGWFGVSVPLLVPPGTNAVLYGPLGMQRTLGPGSHVLWDVPRGTVLVQLVLMARFRRTLGPIEGYSADKWKVRMTVCVDAVVADPVVLAAHTAPLQTLDAAIRTGLLQQFETLSHAALTGLDEHSGGIDGPAAVVLQRLQADPALSGLTILQVRIQDRVGDERRIEAATETAVSIAQLEEAVRLQVAEDHATICTLHGQAARAQAEHDVRMAGLVASEREALARQDFQAQRQTMAAQLRVLEAGIDAHVAQLAHAEQRWQAEQQRWQAEWQATLEQSASAHATDQQVRLLKTQQVLEATLLERFQARDEQRFRLEQELLLMQQHHEQLLQTQREHLESWRMQHDQQLLRAQQSHLEQLALIQGATSIATHVAGPTMSTPFVGLPSGAAAGVAEEGLRTLLRMQTDTLQAPAHQPVQPSHNGHANGQPAEVGNA